MGTVSFFQECPGFSWDRVNFYRNLGGGGIAGAADLNQPRSYSIPCAIMLSIEMGSRPGGALCFRWGKCRVPGGEQLHCASLFLYTFSLVPLLLQFLCVCPSKLPLSPPSRFRFLFLLSPPSPPHPTAMGGWGGEGGGVSERAAAWSFVTGWAETRTKRKFVSQFLSCVRIKICIYWRQGVQPEH